MTKLALLVLIVSTAVGFLNIVQTLEDPQPEANEELRYTPQEEDGEDNERSGARAYASAAIRPVRPFGPSPIPPSPVTPGRSVECYVCTDCPKVLANTTTKLCPFTFDSTKQSTCVVYSEQYKHMKRPWFIRGCAAERGSCADIRQAHSAHADIVRLQSCRECIGDRCNTSGAPRSLADISVAIFALVFTPLVAKYTLS